MNNEKMGQFIAELRKSQQMTQKNLAEKLNISDKAVSKWERGQSYPDISLLSPLADTLGITVTELLNGEGTDAKAVNVEESVVNALEYGEETVKRKLSISQSVWGAAFTIILLIGILSVSIVNVAVSGAFTWSLIPINACIFTWLIFIPVLTRGLKGIFGSLIALSFLIIPFLYLLDLAINQISASAVRVFSYSVRITPLLIILLWAAFILFTRLRTRKLLAAAILVLIASPVSLITNVIIARMLNQSLLDSYTIINALATVVIAIIIFIVEYTLRKRTVS